MGSLSWNVVHAIINLEFLTLNFELFRTVGHELLASPINDEKSGWPASKPASFGGTGFQPVHCTGKMPLPPKNCFRLSCPSPHSPNYFSQSLASWRDLWLF
jgi:hypothetical protein